MNWDRLLTGTLVSCALLTTGLLAYRTLAAPTSRPATSQKPVFVKSWKSDLADAEQLGSASAPVQLIEFADFECPFCGQLHRTLKELLQRYPAKIAVAYMHFPIPGHRFAEPAARVAECAGKQGRFEPMHDHLFEEQDQFGLKPWSAFASEAGVADLAAFDACIQDTAPLARVEAGKKLGKALDVQGTPTLIINGWKLGRPPSAEELDQMVKAILAGKSPVSAT